MASTQHSRYVVGLFENHGEAERVARELASAGFGSGDVDVTDQGHARGITRQLTEHGVPEQHAHYYAEGVRRGDTLVAVSTDDHHTAAAVELMRRHGAIDIDRLADYYRSGGFRQYRETDRPLTAEQVAEEQRRFHAFQTSGGATSSAGRSDDAAMRREDTRVIPETEEQVHVGKERVQGGGVRIYAREREMPVEKDVTLREEHVDVRRRKVDRPATERDMAAFQVILRRNELFVSPGGRG